MTRAVSCVMLARVGRERYIERAVRYFTHQFVSPVQNHELIIVHSDGSQFTEYLTRLTKGLPVVITEHDGTLGARRNHAVSLSNNPIMAVWDDDDIHFANRLKQQMRGMVNDNVFTAESTYLHVFEQNKSVYAIRKDTTGVPDRPWQIVDSSLMVAKELFLKVGGYTDKSIGEDTDLINKLWDAGTFKPRVGQIVFGYVCTGNGMMSVNHHRAIVSEATKLTKESLNATQIDRLVMSELDGFMVYTSSGSYLVKDGGLNEYI